LLAFAANAGALAALSGQDIGVTGVRVAPAQVSLQLAGQHGVAGVIRAAHDKGAHGPELRFDRIAHDAFVGVKHNPTFSRRAQRRIAGVLLADRLSKMTNSRQPPGRAVRIDFSAARV
jgi:hypothetical protein